MKIKRPKTLCRGEFWTIDEEGNSTYCSLGWLGKEVLGLSDTALGRMMSYRDLTRDLTHILNIPEETLVILMYHQDSFHKPAGRIALLAKVLEEHGHQLIEGEENKD